MGEEIPTYQFLTRIKIDPACTTKKPPLLFTKKANLKDYEK